MATTIDAGFAAYEPPVAAKARKGRASGAPSSIARSE
eukprot:CAMPEP_0205900416 /NCGR_PEP_ID=MMETSP1083-20121108/27135_1 /ASSEMBLY_ACC=CAM_ASM_000430 /TAXON_ID=97485 /ORGANISM="Prymnesium parvum, Strain Texoma1" /LENGTH=36 /DNA_ID= /DNA_START= /DNA_END= /DNA_ORIENTATION=